METLSYKKNAGFVAERLGYFYTKRPQNRICALFYTPNKALEKFNIDNPEGFCSYQEPSQRVKFWNAYLEERSVLEDDSMPSAYMSEFDQGLYVGLVGGDAQFMCHDNGWISSMVAPILKDLAEIENLKIDENSIWYKRFIDQMDAFAENCSGKYGISHFILIDGLNFAFELVGATETYMSLTDRPELIKAVIDFAFDLNVKVQEIFFSKAPSYMGGTFSNMVQWLPGKIVSESVDPFHMTSVDYFEKWGRANIEKMYARFDGGVVHIHGNGRHLADAVSTLKGLKAIYLGDDTDYPFAYEVVKDIKKRTGDIPLVLTIPYEIFAQRLDKKELPGGVFYKIDDAPDADTVNRLMEKVRNYRV